MNLTDVMLKAYPIGAYIELEDDSNPGDLLGGLWTEIHDGSFLKAAKSSSSLITGGNSTVILSESNIPSHTHSVSHTHTGGSHTHSCNMSSHSHSNPSSSYCTHTHSATIYSHSHTFTIPIRPSQHYANISNRGTALAVYNGSSTTANAQCDAGGYYATANGYTSSTGSQSFSSQTATETFDTHGATSTGASLGKSSPDPIDITPLYRSCHTWVRTA